MNERLMKELIKDYKTGKIPDEQIKEIEKAIGCSMEDAVANMDKFLDYKKHHVEAMSITDLRRWVEKKRVSDEDKKRYAEVNKCTYEEALHKAKERLEFFDVEKEFKYLDLLCGLTEETREKKRKSQQELIDSGLGKRTSDGVVVVESDNFVEFLRYIYKKK